VRRVRLVPASAQGFSANGSRTRSRIATGPADGSPYRNVFVAPGVAPRIAAAIWCSASLRKLRRRPDGRTALMYAAMFDRVEMVEALLRRGPRRSRGRQRTHRAPVRRGHGRSARRPAQRPGFSLRSSYGAEYEKPLMWSTHVRRRRPEPRGTQARRSHVHDPVVHDLLDLVQRRLALLSIQLAP